MAAKLSRISLTRLYVFIHTQEQEAKVVQQRLKEQMAPCVQQHEEIQELPEKLEEVSKNGEDYNSPEQIPKGNTKCQQEKFASKLTNLYLSISFTVLIFCGLG